MKKIVMLTCALYATSTLVFAPGVSAQKKKTDREKNIESVLQAEKAFLKASMDTSVQLAFDHYSSSDAMLFRPRAVRAATWRTTHPLPPELILTWEPVYADVSRAGDFAYTTGPWASAKRNSDADPNFGQYLTVWRKQHDGRWLLSINASPPGPAEKTTAKFKAAPTAPAYISSGKPLDEKIGLLKADNAYAASVKTLDYAAATKRVATPDMRLLRGAQFPTIGLDSIVKETTGARVTMWLPVEAVVAASADLGYTRGSYVVALPRGAHEQGDYVRIWRRDRNGTWRVALDMLTGARSSR